MSRDRRKEAAPEYTLTDTGPLVALINADDPYHSQASAALGRLPRVPLLTTWPCLTEAMYLPHQVKGHAAQDELWGLLADGLIQLHLPTAEDQPQMRDLMAAYRDAPMDLADASIVAAAEALSVRRVFTFDKHFFAYRLADGEVLEVFS
jgi:predicted nucleic acid-binding protein